jgi:hypothetical protein
MTPIIPLIPTILFIILCVAPLSVLILLFKGRNRQHHPCRQQGWLRGPGQGLEQEREELVREMLAKVLFIPLVPLTISSIHAIQVALSAKPVGSTVLFAYLLGAGALVFTLTRDVAAVIKKRRGLELAHSCQVAVGQELTLLTTAGFRIFHDFPLADSAIHHIAIGPQGIFAVECLAVASTTHKDKARLRFDGRHLHLPDRTTAEPLEQARSKAGELAAWLAATSMSTAPVTPVLAIPDWHLDGQDSDDMRIYNGRNPAMLAAGPVVLPDKQLQALVRLLDRHNRQGEGETASS